MTSILVSGLINLETTVQIDQFPIHYSPVRFPFFGVHASVSGVGYNIAKALTRLGDNVRLLSIIGKDPISDLVKKNFLYEVIDAQFIIQSMDQTAQSVILYDRDGSRQINVDLKDIQDRDYPIDLFEQAISQSDVAALCNINFSRQLLEPSHKAGKMIATDVHAVSDLDDRYNKDFMKAADLLFMSDESLPCAPDEWAQRVSSCYGNEVIVIGLGAKGALLAVKSDHFLEIIPAIKPEKVVNTIGAGDALFSSFFHFYAKNKNPYEAIGKAMIFASIKIGYDGAADGFISEDQLNQLYFQGSIKELV
jgi:sugar/nucleoside kinase (ribokinase family)